MTCAAPARVAAPKDPGLSATERSQNPQPHAWMGLHALFSLRTVVVSPLNMAMGLNRVVCIWYWVNPLHLT